MIDGPCCKSPKAEELPEAADFRAAMGRFLQWFIEGKTTGQIGLRVLVATHKLRPDLIGGISFQDIAGQAGYGRSAAHNLSEDFEKFFPVGRMRLDRSAIARAAYARSHARRNAQGPGSGRMDPPHSMLESRS
jgi:hypothetical protein